VVLKEHFNFSTTQVTFLKEHLYFYSSLGFYFIHLWLIIIIIINLM